MLPEITPSNVVAAIAVIQRIQIPDPRNQRKYELHYFKKQFPVKIVVDIAGLIAQDAHVASDVAQAFIENNRSLFNADQARDRLIKLGFPVTSVQKGDETAFFSLEEFDFFKGYANHPYDSADSVIKNAGMFIADTIWEKSKYWAMETCRRTGLTFDNRKPWRSLTQSGKERQVIKHYTWYRMYDVNATFPHIFFTVGADANLNALVFKLDYRIGGDDALSKIQVEIFQEFCREHSISDRLIPYEEIINYGWYRLINETEAFINVNLQSYNKLQRLLAAQQDVRFVRICFNRFGWVQPSGREGKSSLSETSQEILQERDHGFAPDEWLFDTDRIAADGFHYARVEPLTPKKHIGKVFNLTFYTFNSIDRTWYWVGEADNVEVIGPDLSIQIAKEYEERGWKSEQLAELQLFEDVEWQQYDRLSDGNRFNLRYRPENLRTYEPLPIPEGLHPGQRYNLVKKQKAPVVRVVEEIGDFDFSSGGRNNGQRKQSRNYKGGQRELINIHGEILDEFETKAQHLFPDFILDTEVRKHGLLHRVDIVGSKGRRQPYTLFEVKTYPSLLHSIRVAVGQLLEYAFYPAQDLSREFYIISHISAGEDVYRYLRHLNEQLPVNFGYIYYNVKEKAFELQLRCGDATDRSFASRKLNNT